METPSKNMKVLKRSALNMIKGGLASPIVKEENDNATYASTSSTTTNTTNATGSTAYPVKRPRRRY